MKDLILRLQSKRRTALHGGLLYVASNATVWLLALAFTSIAVYLVGDSPKLVLKVLFTSGFGTAENFSYTLFYATPLLLTGTAVALALEAGLFNIGAEGQLYMGALAAGAFGVATRHLQLTSGVAVSLALLAAACVSFAGGAAWGAVAGYLRTRRQVHEVIATIMLNFIAMALANWAILHPLKNHDTQNLETLGIADALRLPHAWGRMTWGFPAAVVIGVLALWAVQRTWWGFRVRTTGRSETAAGMAGMRVSETAFRAMALSGGIAGLVGFHEVYCNSYKLLDGFSAGFGFTGLAVALLARGSIPGLIASSILFGALHKGSLDLDLETDRVTRDLSAVIEALVLVALAAQPRINRLLDRFSSERKRGAK